MRAPLIAAAPRPAPVAFARLVASGFGSGYAPRAPGTAGSAVALLAGALLLWISPYALAAAMLLATFGGFWAVGRATGLPRRPAPGDMAGHDDPSWVVVDEFAGQFLALLALPRPTPRGLLAAFVLFRLFDILKPGPVGWADRQGGVAGIMADDVIAGGIAALILWGVQARWPGVFG